MSKKHDEIIRRLDAIATTIENDGIRARQHEPVACVTVEDLPQVRERDEAQQRTIAAGDAEIRLLRATVRDLVATLESALDVPVIRHAEMRRAVAKARKALGSQATYG